MKDEKICAEKRTEGWTHNRKRSARSGDLCPATLSCKVKGNESRTKYSPVNKTKPSYGATETIGTFSTTMNKKKQKKNRGTTPC